MLQHVVDLDIIAECQTGYINVPAVQIHMVMDGRLAPNARRVQQIAEQLVATIQTYQLACATLDITKTYQDGAMLFHAPHIVSGQADQQQEPAHATQDMQARQRSTG